MRRDTPLLGMLGLKSSPSARRAQRAETVEGVIKYLALEREGRAASNGLLRVQSRRSLEASKRSELLSCEGFIPFWTDGSHLEVEGEDFDSIKVIEHKRGQVVVGSFVGPWLVGMDFAVGHEGEETVGRRLIESGVEEVLRPAGLMKEVLILEDSLYGDGPTLDQLEGYEEKPSYVVGVLGLKEAQRLMAEALEWQWRDTGPQPRRGWEASGVATMWLQCGDWKVKRTMVCRRWKNEGELIWNYAAVGPTGRGHEFDGQ